MYLFILGTSPLPGEASFHRSLRGFGAAGVAHLQLPPGGPGSGCYAAMVSPQKKPGLGRVARWKSW